MSSFVDNLSREDKCKIIFGLVRSINVCSGVEECSNFVSESRDILQQILSSLPEKIVKTTSSSLTLYEVVKQLKNITYFPSGHVHVYDGYMVQVLKFREWTPTLQDQADKKNALYAAMYNERFTDEVPETLLKYRKNKLRRILNKRGYLFIKYQLGNRRIVPLLKNINLEDYAQTLKQHTTYIVDRDIYGLITDLFCLEYFQPKIRQYEFYYRCTDYPEEILKHQVLQRHVGPLHFSYIRDQHFSYHVSAELETAEGTFEDRITYYFLIVMDALRTYSETDPELREFLIFNHILKEES